MNPTNSRAPLRWWTANRFTPSILPRAPNWSTALYNILYYTRKQRVCCNTADFCRGFVAAWNQMYWSSGCSTWSTMCTRPSWSRISSSTIPSTDKLLPSTTIAITNSSKTEGLGLPLMQCLNSARRCWRKIKNTSLNLLLCSVKLTYWARPWAIP